MNEDPGKPQDQLKGKETHFVDGGIVCGMKIGANIL